MGEQTEFIAKSNNVLVMTICRQVLTGIAGYLMGNGFIDGDAITTPMIDTVAGAIGIIITLIWSKKNQAKLKGENVKKD